MSDTTVAHPAPESTRITRGIGLHREHADEIERIGIHAYRVPSCTGTGSYTVYSDLRCCTCPDHPKAKSLGERCKHVVCVEISIAKRRAKRARLRIAV